MKKLVFSLFFYWIMSNVLLFSAWVDTPDKPADSSEKDLGYRIVKSLNAQNSKGKILLTWQKANKEKIQYKIYRSNSIIDKSPKLESATLLTTLPEDKNSYFDSGTEEEIYYYAITVLDNEGNEDKLLAEGYNFTMAPITQSEVIEEMPVTMEGEETKNTNTEIVSFISAYQLEDNNVSIEWEDATADSYAVYRNTQMISSNDILKSSTFLDSVLKGVENYKDVEIKESNNYYYAVIKKNAENILLIPDSNYTTIPVIYEKPKPEPIKAEKPIVKKPEIKPEIKIEPKKIEKPKIVKKPESKKVIIKPEPVKKKVTIKKKKVQRINYSLWLENSIKKYYLKKRYLRSIKELNKIVYSKAPKKVKLKAKLFLGRSYYERQDYRRALKYFSQSKEIYHMESDFWINKALKKIR
ncbi:MAG: hypothetical protein KKH98_03950 [Spirochaetes bacterium]|nr:hypothetical protein [Spirochaetota bacterium]